MRDIKNYEGLYAITSCGRVWSYKRQKFLKPGNDGGYYRIDLYKNGKRKRYLIHRLVAEAYLPNPDNLLQVNHKDENKLNNALPNLEWISQKDNINYGTGKERSAKSRQKKVICIETGQVFESIKEAAKVVDIAHGNISNCLTGRQKTSGGYHWRYYEKEEI